MTVKTNQPTIEALKVAMKEIDGEGKKIRVYLAGMG